MKKAGLFTLFANIIFFTNMSVRAMQTTEAYKERALKEYIAQQQKECNELSLQFERELVKCWLINNRKSKTVNVDACLEFVWQKQRALNQAPLDESTDEEEDNELDAFLHKLDSYSYFDV